MGKLKCKCCIQPKLRELKKIIKKPQKYSKKYIEQIIDQDFIPELTKGFENLGICYPSSDILEIFDTVDMGKGVRAKEKLYKGQRLGCYMGEIKHNDEQSRDWRYNFAYVLKDFYIDGKDESLICYMNHSSKPNVKIIWEKHCDEIHIVFVANEVIDEGDELFIDYGEDYWKYARSQNIRPEGRQKLITEYFI
jgi:SET domain-containing protein